MARSADRQAGTMRQQGMVFYFSAHSLKQLAKLASCAAGAGDATAAAAAPAAGGGVASRHSRHMSTALLFDFSFFLFW